MTEQEILALTEEDVQKMIKLRMMEEGIKIMDKPKIPELFEIEPADIQYFSIPLLDGFAFTDINEATKVAEILKSAKSLRKVDYDWNKLGSDYKFLKKSERYKFNGNSDFDIISGWAYSDELYAKISNFAAQNKVMKEQAAKDQKEYDEKMQEASGIISEISGWVKEVKVKYERLNRLTYKFATDYYPLSDHNEDMAMKFMAKAYSFTDKEKEIVGNVLDLSDKMIRADYFKDKIGITLVVVTGILFCGIATICCYDFTLFEQMSLNRLFLLSMLIPLPTYLWFIFMEAEELFGEENEVYLFCMEENVLAFLFTLILKMFVPQMTVHHFVVILFIMTNVVLHIARRKPILFVRRKKSYEIFLKMCKKNYPDLYEDIKKKIIQEKKRTSGELK